nr:glycine-rich cell wall structural protein 1.8-like [Lolium perenne]
MRDRGGGRWARQPGGGGARGAVGSCGLVRGGVRGGVHGDVRGGVQGGIAGGATEEGAGCGPGPALAVDGEAGLALGDLAVDIGEATGAIDGDQSFLDTVGFGFSETQPESPIGEQATHQLSIKRHHQRSVLQ